MNLNLIKDFFFNKNKLITYNILFALIASAIIFNIKFDLLEVFIFDAQIRMTTALKIKPVAAPSVALVEITPDTIKKFSGYPKATDHIKLIQNIFKCNNCYVVYNIKKIDGQLANIDGTYSDKLSFADLTNQFKNMYFIFDDMDISGDGAKLSSKLNVPLDKITLSSAPKTIDTKLNSKTAVTRRIILNYKNQDLFHLSIAKKFNATLNDEKNISGSFEKSGTNQVFINFYPKNSFPTYSFESIYNGETKPSDLDNKIIIIGENTYSSIDDYSDSPFATDSKDIITTSELHANMIQTLIDNVAPKKIPTFANFILTLILSIISVYVALSSKPSKGIFILFTAFISFLIISGAMLAKFNIWLDMAHPLLTIFLCYYFFIPYRLIIENRRSWEYIQKNKLLQQVEELKTNFISMMSHDLKTPIARIQGMTEVILQDNVALSSTQREAVDTIKGSSDDLLKFINSILQYGRIESNGVELHKQAKDVNQVLQDVIKKHEFLSKVKKIKVITELEPMFPIQIDVDLMKQVFSNLIENAIKYSHEESTVIVKSREEGPNVIIEVTDNGVGIPTEDLPNIFMKFYRSHNVKTSTIKGSGLGLYLAQYFTQLHKGEITVTSEKDKGSTFKVTLPA